MSKSLSQEFYELSKIKNLLKSEINNLNKKMVHFDLKKKLIIEDNAKIENLSDFNDNEKIQIFSNSLLNGIDKNIAIIKLGNGKNKLDKNYKGIDNIDDNIDYVAIDIQHRYKMKNEEYFKTHFSPIYYEKYNEGKSNIEKIKEKPDIINFNIENNKIKYTISSLLPSRKQNLTISFKTEYQRLINSLSKQSDLQKNILLSKYIKSIDNRLKDIEINLKKNSYNIDKQFCDFNYLEKEEEIQIDVSKIFTDTERTLNGHAMIKRALKNGEKIVSNMYEEILEFKIIEVGSKENVLNKIETIINSLNNKVVQNNELFENMIESDFSEQYMENY